MEYAHWVEEQSKQAAELRTALQAHAPEIQLRILVDAGLAHYDALFRAKSVATRSDAFFVLSGVWRTPTERFFLWVGGFRPSELLKILAPQLEPLTEQQTSAVCALQQTARQLEDALSQGMYKLQQTLVEVLMTVDSPDAAGGGYTAQQMASALGKLDGLAGFVDQVILLPSDEKIDSWHGLPVLVMTRELRIYVLGVGGPSAVADAAEHAQDPDGAAGGAGAARALGDYCQRLRALSSLWAAYMPVEIQEWHM